MDESSKAEVRKGPRWKFLFWSQLVLVLLWFGLRNIPSSLEEKGAVGAIDLLLLVLGDSVFSINLASLFEPAQMEDSFDRAWVCFGSSRRW